MALAKQQEYIREQVITHSLTHLLTYLLTYLLTTRRRDLKPSARKRKNKKKCENVVKKPKLYLEEAKQDQPGSYYKHKQLHFVTLYLLSILSLIRTLTHSPTHSPTHSLTYLLTHSPTYSLIYSLTHVIPTSLTSSTPYPHSFRDRDIISAKRPPSPVLTRTGRTMSWFWVNSNMSMELVSGARNKAPRVAAAPTVA